MYFAGKRGNTASCPALSPFYTLPPINIYTITIEISETPTTYKARIEGSQAKVII
jgi:hypothetical protein